MKIEWDPGKGERNFKKHRIRFSDAESVLFDPCTLSMEDESSEGEQRFVALGGDLIGRVLVVIYSYKGKNIRLISARRATAKERRRYEEGI